jgi:hypothetical protein
MHLSSLMNWPRNLTSHSNHMQEARLQPTCVLYKPAGAHKQRGWARPELCHMCHADPQLHLLQ